MNFGTELINILSSHPEGLSLENIESILLNQNRHIPPGVAECLLLLTGKCSESEGRWFCKIELKHEAVLKALNHHAEESKRRIFKSDMALQNLPDNLKPTREELAQILLTSNKYELLKNDMIREKD